VGQNILFYFRGLLPFRPTRPTFFEDLKNIGFWRRKGADFASFQAQNAYNINAYYD
jgi:hypothetical protein